MLDFNKIQLSSPKPRVQPKQRGSNDQGQRKFNLQELTQQDISQQSKDPEEEVTSKDEIDDSNKPLVDEYV